MLAGIICLTVGITALCLLTFATGYYIGGKKVGRAIMGAMWEAQQNHDEQPET